MQDLKAGVDKEGASEPIDFFSIGMLYLDPRGPGAKPGKSENSNEDNLECNPSRDVLISDIDAAKYDCLNNWLSHKSSGSVVIRGC